MSIRAEINELNPTVSDFRKTGWTVGGVLLAIAAVIVVMQWRRGEEIHLQPLLVGLGALLVVLAMVAPKLLRPFYWGWMGFAVVMGFFMSRVILTIFFFLVITPVGLVFKLIGRDALHRKLNRQAATYWIDKEYLIKDRSRFEKFF